MKFPTSPLVPIAASILLIASCNSATQTESTDADLVIRNARIVDGTGSPWTRGDVAIRDGKILAMGPALDIEGAEIIEADGRVLAPGFIDIHTHVESSGSRDGLEGIPRADNFLLDGVTTIITGNCGSSETDLAAYRNRLDMLGINVATLIGHNSIRRQVMGSDDRAPTAEELEAMQALIEKAMQEGAVGFSTGLLYVPGTYAKTDEVVSLAKVAAAHGGVYSSHIREQGAKLHDSVNEAVFIGQEADMPVQVSHFKVKGRTRWGTIGDAIALVEGHRKNGIDVVIDAYPYERASTNLGVNLPRWAVAGSAENIAERINNPESRARIITGMREMLDDGGYPDYSFATVAQYAPNPELNGMTISEINLSLNREPTIENEIETVLEMMLEGGAAGNSQGGAMVYHYMSTDDVDTILKYPNAAVASDGGVITPGRGHPHPRSYGTNARVLADYVRNRGVLTLEDAIRRMTSLPARTFGFQNRGIIRPGFIADLVLFDPERVVDKATFTDPHNYSEGFDTVIVNGVSVVSDGQLTDRRPGTFIAFNEK